MSASGEGGTLRLFVAVLAPPGVRAAVAVAQAALRREAAVRWIDPGGAHLTLQFLGATPTDRLPALMAALARVAGAAQPLALRTAGLGIFPTPARTRVIWLGLTGQFDRLAALQAAVVAATGPLGFVAEERAFSPHLTLGRVRSEAAPAERARLGQLAQTVAAPATAEWPVEDLVLMVSTLSRSGASYQAVGRWRLGSGASLGTEAAPSADH